MSVTALVETVAGDLPGGGLDRADTAERREGSFAACQSWISKVGLALDRTGFTVEDRDRAAGLYYVRYVDPKNAGKEEPSWWARLWGDKSNPQEALRYRVLVKGDGAKTNVSIQTSAGAAETGDNAQRIIGLLGNEIR